MPNKDMGRDFYTPLMGVFFIAVAGITFWDTTSYTDPDSYVFPRAVALVMTGLSIALIVQWLIVRPKSELDLTGANFRRIGLVVLMLGASLLMPWLGFLLTGLILFISLIFIAMYDPWTPARLVIYPLIGAGMVFGFYFIFKNLLLVPLPVGSLFGG